MDSCEVIRFPDGGKTILPMPNLNQPDPIGHTRRKANGVIVQVRTWAQNPAPECSRCEVCTVGPLQCGGYQCVQIDLSRGLSLPGA